MAATMARTLSTVLTAAPAEEGAGARLALGGAGGAAVVRVGGPATRLAAAPAAGGAGGFGAAAAGGTAADGGGAAAKGAGALAAGSVGSLIVAEDAPPPADGLGGQLMRTVSLRGCTLGASDGLGGTAPPGMFGLSAIATLQKLKFDGKAVKL